MNSKEVIKAMKSELLINSKTGEEYVDVPPSIAAEYLGVALNFIYQGLQKHTLPIGTAVQSNKGRWTYNIPCERLRTPVKQLIFQLCQETQTNTKAKITK